MFVASRKQFLRTHYTSLLLDALHFVENPLPANVINVMLEILKCAEKDNPILEAIH